MSSSLSHQRATQAGILFSGGEFADDSTARAHRRARDAGTLVQLTPGAFVETSTWAELYPSDRYHLRVMAHAHKLRPETVFSHASAASLLGIRMLGAWTHPVVTTVSPSSGLRSTPRLRRVRAPLDASEIVEVGGILCTSPARTVTDLARTLPFTDAVAAADSALHRKRWRRLLTLDELEGSAPAEPSAPRRGHKRMQRVVGFTTPLSDSVQESRSRVLIHQLGFPAPVLQQPWRDARGHIGETDFWWPKFRIAGEFDGRVKYLNREMWGNRTPEQVLFDEKVREDRIRRLGVTMARWIVDELDDPLLLRAILLEAGLPLVRSRDS